MIILTVEEIIEAHSKCQVFGMGGKLFTIAEPVILY